MFVPVYSANGKGTSVVPERLATSRTGHGLLDRYYGGTTETVKTVLDNDFPRVIAH